MKKILLGMAALATFACASAADISLLNDNSFTKKEYPSSEIVPATAVDGVYTVNVVVNNTAEAVAWDTQFFIQADRTLDADQTYTFTMKVKASKDVKIDMQAHLNPGGYKHWTFAGGSFNATTEWSDYTFTGTVPSEAAGSDCIAMNLSVSDTDYTIEFKDITWTIPGGDTPVDPKPEGLVGEWYTGNGATFGGWGGSATFENVDEDGKPCLKFTNPEEKEFWAVQAAINAKCDAGTKYYLSFDIKGDAATGLTCGFQGSGDVDGETKYDGKGDFTPFDVTPEWKSVVLECECGEGQYPQLPAERIVFNLGTYVGTFYMTNVVLSTKAPAGLDAVAVAPVAHWTVYNLHGVKVLDTDCEAAVNELPAGIYVVNGKKVAVRK